MASTLRILPEIETKSLVCEGIIAVREAVALTVVMPPGSMESGDDIHVRIRGKLGDVAKFPFDDADEWTATPDDAGNTVLTATLNCNTDALIKSFRFIPENGKMTFLVAVENDTQNCLVARGRVTVMNWIGDGDMQDPVTIESELAEIAELKRLVETKVIDSVEQSGGRIIFTFGDGSTWESDDLTGPSGPAGVSMSDIREAFADVPTTYSSQRAIGTALGRVVKTLQEFGLCLVAFLALAASATEWQDVPGETVIGDGLMLTNGEIVATAKGGGGGTDGEAVTNIVRSLEKSVAPYMWPGDWYIRIAGSIPGAPAGTYLMPTNDMLARMTGASGVWRSYQLFAEPDSVAASYGDPVPPVSFDYRDPSGAVSAFTNNTLLSSGVPGVVHISASDTNGVTREAAVVMTPVRPGNVANLYAAETNVTERYLWAANLFEKLAAVSTAEADLVANNYCRSFAERYEAWKYTTWKSARQLSRFGSDGRIHTNEWAGAMINSSTWADLATPTTARAWAFKQNRDFFWPALQTNLWCFSSACHEGHAAPPALGKDSNGNPIKGYRSVPLMAVAPHYAVGAAHYGDWVLSAWQCHPRFVRSTNDNDYVLSHIGGAVGTVTYASGNDSDIRLYRLQQTVPDQCIAHFATREVLQSLSPTLFKYVPCLTINAHQTVTPYCLGGTGSTLYGWKAEPRTSTFTSPYPDGIDVPAQAADCVHMGHMYDSGDPFFLVAPNGRVIPIGQTMYLNDGGGLSGPSYLADGVLESLSAMIRSDSNGTEDIRFWTAADLYAGGVTNLVEDAP